MTARFDELHATIAALRAELERKDAALCAIEKASACPWSCLVARAAQ